MFQKIECKIEKVGFEKVAVFFILFFGICLRIVTPPYQVADEIFHFPRAWQISECKFISPSVSVRNAENSDNPALKKIIQAYIKEGKLYLHDEDEKLLLTEAPHSMIPKEVPMTVIPKQIVFSLNDIKNFLCLPLNSE